MDGKNYRSLSVFDEADFWLILPAALLSLLAAALFVPLELGVNVPVFIFLLYVAVFAYQGRTKSKSDRDSIYFLLIVLLASLPFILYDTSPFRILQFALLGFFVLFQIFTMYGCRKYKHLSSECWLYDAVNAVVFMPFANVPAALKILLSSRMRTAFVILSAFVLSPALTIALYSACGKGFAACAGAYLLGFALFTLLYFYLYGFLYGCRRASFTDVLKKPDPEKLRRVPAWVSISVLSLFCLGCAAYILTQILYFLPVNGNMPLKSDLSEFARRGFLELCGVVLANLAVIGLSVVFTRVRSKENGRNYSKVLTALIVVLCVLSILLVAEAFLKMLLYMKVYGLTTNRIITSVFMLGLAIVCAFIILRAFSLCMRPIRAISIAAVTLFLLLCFADCDYLALSYNRTAYLSGQLSGFDIDMLYDCGDSIVPVMIDVYDNSTGTVKTDALRFLDNYRDTSALAGNRIRSFNIASYNARNKYLQWKNE